MHHSSLHVLLDAIFIYLFHTYIYHAFLSQKLYHSRQSQVFWFSSHIPTKVTGPLFDSEKLLSKTNRNPSFGCDPHQVTGVIPVT